MEASCPSPRVAALLGCALVAASCHASPAALMGGQPISAAELDQARGQLAIVDTRDAETFAAAHIPGAYRVDLDDLNGFLAAPPFDTSTPLVLVCYSGRSVSLAVPTASMHGFTDVRVLAGGYQAWRQLGLPSATGPGPAHAFAQTPQVEWTYLQQVVSFSGGGVIKLLYMILTFVLLRRLRRATDPALRLLWHGLLWFFVGEAFCVLNFFLHGSGLLYTLDLLHGVGMVIMSALIPWGLYRLFDDRVLHFADPERRCTLQPLCGHCWKKEPVVCALHRIMLFGAVALLLLALIPLSSPLRPAQVIAVVLGEPTDFGVPIGNHLVELRLYPLLAVVALAATFAVLLRGGQASARRAEPVFFVGFGLMSYPLLRHFLVNTYYGAPYWSDFWEELTELLLAAGIAWILYLLREQLDLAPRTAPRKE